MINEKLKELRLSKGWSQTQLAAKLNVSNKLISKWERGGATPDISYLKKYSELFSISVDSLIDNEVHLDCAVDYDKIKLAPRDRRPAYAAVIIWCALFIIYIAGVFTVVFVIPNNEFPVWAKVLLAVIPTSIIMAMIAQAAIRIKEIKGGEEDDSRKY